MTRINKYFIILTALALTALTGCKDRWEEHNELKEAALKESLMEPITANPNLSKFAEYLKATGYDAVLSSSKLYTVWAPTNEALASLDPAIASNPERLKTFVGNHISNQEYYTYTPSPTLRIRALNGKYLTWDRTTANIEGASVVEGDQQKRNGVLHIIDKPIAPVMNTWEFLNATTVGNKQKAYINSLSFNSFNPALAERTGVDPVTGAPIYKPGTGIVWRNRFLENARQIMHEDTLNTMIILTDAAYQSEFDKIKKFYITSSADSTDSLTAWNVVKDLVFEGVYTRETLPDTLVSIYGVKVPIQKSAIVSSHRTSNGIVHVMNKVDFRLKDKIPPIKIEGESAVRPRDFSTSERNDRIHYRYREWASNLFDLRVVEHGFTGGVWVRYRVNNIPAATYKFYLRATKDFGTFPLIERVTLHRPNPVSETFPLVTIPLMELDEVYVGEYKVDKFGNLDIYVVSNNASNNAATGQGIDLNPLVVDYVRMVPVLQ